MSPITFLRRRRPVQRQRVARVRLHVERLEERALPSVDLLNEFAGLDFQVPTDARLNRNPDTIAAAGPDHVVEMTNQAIAVFTKETGTKVFEQGLFTFFPGYNPADDVKLFDPFVAYDEQAGRFVVTCLTIGPLQPPAPGTFIDNVSFLHFAVSNTSNPLDGFAEMQRIDVAEILGSGPTESEFLWGDFDRLGWNADAYVISMNMFHSNFNFSQDTFHHVQLVTIDKDCVLDADPGTLTKFHVDRDGGNFHMGPARMHDSLPGDPMWFVHEPAAALAGSTISVIEMTNVLSAAPTFTEFSIVVPSFGTPPSATQPDGGNPIYTAFNSFFSVAARGNRLVASHTVGTHGPADSVAHARWYEFDLGGPAPTLRQVGDIDRGLGVHTYYPSIDIAPNGDIGLTFMQSSSSTADANGDGLSDGFLSMYVAGRKAGDPLGTMQAPALVKAGQGLYRGIRLSGVEVALPSPADYSGLSVDPVDGTFWAANVYSTGIVPPPSRLNWGTWIANFSLSSGGASASGRLYAADGVFALLEAQGRKVRNGWR